MKHIRELFQSNFLFGISLGFMIGLGFLSYLDSTNKRIIIMPERETCNDRRPSSEIVLKKKLYYGQSPELRTKTVYEPANLESTLYYFKHDHDSGDDCWSVCGYYSENGLKQLVKRQDVTVRIINEK